MLQRVSIWHQPDSRRLRGIGNAEGLRLEDAFPSLYNQHRFRDALRDNWDIVVSRLNIERRHIWTWYPVLRRFLE